MYPSIMSLHNTPRCFEKDYFALRLAEKKCERHLSVLASHAHLQRNLDKRSRQIRKYILQELTMKTEMLYRFILHCRQFIMNEYERVSKDGLGQLLQSKLGNNITLYIQDFYRPRSSDINQLYLQRGLMELPVIPNYIFDFEKLRMIRDR